MRLGWASWLTNKTQGCKGTDNMIQQTYSLLIHHQTPCCLIVLAHQWGRATCWQRRGGWRWLWWPLHWLGLTVCWRPRGWQASLTGTWVPWWRPAASALWTSVGSAEGDTVESMSAIISRERGSVEAKRVMVGERMRKVGREAGRWEIRPRKTVKEHKSWVWGKRLLRHNIITGSDRTGQMLKIIINVFGHSEISAFLQLEHSNTICNTSIRASAQKLYNWFKKNVLLFCWHLKFSHDLATGF